MACGCCGRVQMGWYDRKVRRVRDLSCGGVECCRCGKATSDLLSLRFIFFCLVGIVGISVHFIALSIGVALFGLSFQWAQTLAIVVAIANNFALNNAITYRDQRLTGVNYLVGLLLFYLISSIDALSNMSVGNWLFGHEQTWLVAGLGGAAMSVVWNYAVSSMMVWCSR